MARKRVYDSYGAGLETLDEWIGRLRSMPEMVNASAQQLVPVVRADIDRAIAEGRSVDGRKWLPKKDGGRALVNAAKAVMVEARKNVILITLTGPEVFHQFGTKRIPARPIIPSGNLPDRIGNAIRKGLVDMGIEWMTRKGRHDRGSGGVKMKPRMK